MQPTTQSRAVEVSHVRALVRHLLLWGAYSLSAAASAMLVVIVLIGVFSGDFPAVWLTAVVGCAAAALVLRQGARNLPEAPRLSAGR